MTWLRLFYIILLEQNLAAMGPAMKQAGPNKMQQAAHTSNAPRTMILAIV